jgi:hypothetical protein
MGRIIAGRLFIALVIMGAIVAAYGMYSKLQLQLQQQQNAMARLQSYCADMARITINDDLEKVLPGARAEATSACVAAAVRTAQYRNGQ